MASTLPTSRLVSVAVNMTPQPAQAQNLSTLLLLGTSDVIDTVERTRTYSSLSAVAADFGTTAPEYMAAALWFGQSPQPGSLRVGVWASSATKGGLRCAPLPATSQALSTWNTILNGAFTVTVGDAGLTTVTGLNFSTATTLAGVAAIIDTALAGASCVWNAVYQRFEFKSDVAGATTGWSFLGTPASGGATDISALLGGTAASSGAYVVQGIAAETPVSVVAELDNTLGQAWYALAFTAALLDAQVLAVAQYVEGANTKHVYGHTTQQAGALVAATTTDIASQLKALGYKKTLVQFSSSNAYAVVSGLARILTTDYTASATAITLMYKQEPGVVAEFLSASQADALRAKNCNALVAYNNSTQILQHGVMSSGDFVDVILGVDWFAVTLQNSLYNVLYTSPTKIPQTDAGMHTLATVMASVCSQAVTNGLAAPGTWTNSGFGQLKQGDFLPAGFYIYAPKVADQNPADRAARKSVPFQIALKLAGAVHEVSLAVNVNA